MSTLDVKVFFGFIALVGVLMLLGSIPEEQKPREPWYQPEEVRRTNSYHARRSNEGFYRYKAPAWKDDRKEETEEWEEFLEELDNRGYDLWDPEAEDIWEKYK